MPSRRRRVRQRCSLHSPGLLRRRLRKPGAASRRQVGPLPCSRTPCTFRGPNSLRPCPRKSTSWRARAERVRQWAFLNRPFARDDSWNGQDGIDILKFLNSSTVQLKEHMARSVIGLRNCGNSYKPLLIVSRFTRHCTFGNLTVAALRARHRPGAGPLFHDDRSGYIPFHLFVLGVSPRWSRDDNAGENPCSQS